MVSSNDRHGEEGLTYEAAVQLRLLICCLATHPDKMDDAKAAQWQRMLDLSQEDMTSIFNLENLGVQIRKKASSSTKSRILRFGKGSSTPANTRKVNAATVLGCVQVL